MITYEHTMFLYELERAGGNRIEGANMFSVGWRLGFGGEKTKEIFKYLEERGLVELTGYGGYPGGCVRITGGGCYDR